jgi:hypothetical protein
MLCAVFRAPLQLSKLWLEFLMMMAEEDPLAPDWGILPLHLATS